MILQQRQSRRFFRLFDEVIYFAFDELGITQHTHGNTPNVQKAIWHVWGPEGDGGCIDRLLEARASRLSKMDLRTLASWKQGINGEYLICRRDHDAVFLLDDYAFAVRGITEEVWSTRSLPALSKTVLLPFDGLITYSVLMLTDQLTFGPGSTADIERAADAAIEAKRFIRSERDFLKRHDEVLAAIEEGNKRESKAEQADLAERASELGEGQHRGALAGLAPEERESAIDAHYAQLRQEHHDMILAEIDKRCDLGEPVDTLEEAFLSMGKSKLRTLVGLTSPEGEDVSSMSWSELAALARERHDFFDRTAILVRAALSGPEQMRSVRDVYRAGGRLEYRFDDVEALDDVPEPCFPVTALYRTSDRYVLVMPREVRENLKYTRWDTEISRVEAQDTVIGYLNTLMSLRGIVEVEDAVKLAEQAANLDEHETKAAMLGLMRTIVGRGGIVFSLMLYNEKSYFVHRSLAGVSKIDEMGRPTETSHIDAILAAQAKQDPRPLDDLEPGTLAFNLLDEGGALRRLTSFFDEHVPDTADDYTFADDACQVIVEGIQMGLDVGVVFAALERLGFVPTDAQLDLLLTEVVELLNTTPLWMCNGWSLKDNLKRTEASDLVLDVI